MEDINENDKKQLEYYNMNDEERSGLLLEVLPDLYRMARIAYNIQTDQLSTQQEALRNVMLNTKTFLSYTATVNNKLDQIEDIVSDNITSTPAPPDPTSDNIDIALEKGQGI